VCVYNSQQALVTHRHTGAGLGSRNSASI
jgi:hypothetical protein